MFACFSLILVSTGHGKAVQLGGINAEPLLQQGKLSCASVSKDKIPLILFLPAEQAIKLGRKHHSPSRLSPCCPSGHPVGHGLVSLLFQPSPCSCSLPVPGARAADFSPGSSGRAEAGGNKRSFGCKWLCAFSKRAG